MGILDILGGLGQRLGTGLDQATKSPAGDIGLRMLAGNTPHSSLLQSLGQATLGRQAALTAAQDDELKRRYMMAQIAALGLKQPVEPKRYTVDGALVDENGKALYTSPQKPVVEKPPEGMHLNPATGALEWIPGYISGRGAIAAAGRPPEQPASTQLTPRPTQDGKIQDYAFNPKTKTMDKVGDPYEKPTNLSPKDVSTAKAKLIQISTAEKQIADIKAAREALRNSMSSGGFGQGYIPSEAGKKFDAAVDAIRSTFSGMTRVPGVGSQSDWEGKLNMAPLPSRTEYESVQDQKINQIENMIAGMRAGYTDLLSGPDTTAPPGNGPSSRPPLSSFGK